MLKSTFRVIPVLDVKDGLAVHAVGGQRSHYRPVRSLLHPSADPLDLARAYRDILGSTNCTWPISMRSPDARETMPSPRE